MSLVTRVLALAALALAVLPAVAPAQTPSPGGSTPAAGVVSVPSARTLYKDGPSGRFLMDGTWLYRPDPQRNGDRLGWQRDPATTGWAATSVPNAWNATDESPASFAGAVGWYRRDFRLPTTAKGPMWIVRFESVNYRAKIWLNGKPIGTHSGAYLPFELRLPRGYLKRTGVNRLVVRVDSRRNGSDFPPAKFDVRGRPLGGWWNYGGLLREVYLRRVDDIDLSSVDVRPDLPCATCDATVTWNVTARNAGTASRTISLTGRFGARIVPLGRATIGPKSSLAFSKRITVRRPKLWSPDRPYLYDADLKVTSGKRTLQRFTRSIGVRSIKISGGRLLLNGRALDVRGVGLQEDSRARGFAIDNAVRDQQIGWVRDLGATLIRAHYSLHPYTLEQADRLGLLVWSEIPVYQVDTEELARKDVRDAAVNVMRGNVEASRDHPSILAWSIGNELSARPGPSQATYIKRAADTARALDPTRPVALAVAAAPTVGCQTEAYAPLDLIGINDYFGWYPGTNGVIADRDLLSDYLDTVRACYPNKAIMISEFGAEANRSGPQEERGTFEFQSDFVNFHLAAYATKPWLSGAIWWALQEFRVRPNWDGGNPRPNSPIHEKGLVTFDGARKPAYADIQRLYKATQQIAPAGG